MELIASKGGRKVIRNNFMYHLNKTLRNGNTYWEFDKRWSGSSYKAKVVLNQSGEHTHVPDPEKNLVE